MESFWTAERAFDLLSDRTALAELFESLDPTEWEGVIQSLEIFQNDYPHEAVEPATVVLLNLLPRIPERQRSMFDFFDKNLAVTRVVLRLLRRLPNSESIETVVRNALPSIVTLSGKLELLTTVGNRDGGGNALISAAASSELEAALRNAVRSASQESLTVEPELFWLLNWTKSTSSPSEPSFHLSLQAPLACRLLKATVSELLRQGLGTRAIQREKRLEWDSLTSLVGGEGNVQEMIDACSGMRDDPELEQALELAKKYLSGWRPKRY